MTRFAEKTRVPVGQSRTEIEALLKRYGAKAFMTGQSATEAVIAFEAKDRRVMFRLPMPDGVTVGSHVKPVIADSYQQNKLLPFFGERK